MQEINKASVVSAKILGEQGYKEGIKYRPIKYLLETKLANGKILYNTLTGHIFYLGNKEISSLTENTENEIFKTLVNNWFFVPEEYNEYNLYNLLFTFTKQANKNKKKAHYTILPTTDCNARCFYCFEHGMKKYTMSEQTAQDIAEFISKNSSENGISIEWFGGEPLYNKAAIDIICRKLKDNNIDFYSTMISNGYLFDDELILKAKKEWNINRVQVTLDGTEKIYNKYKAYIYREDKSPFRRVIANIKKLLENDITVFIRINLGMHNIDDAYKLVDFLKSELKSSSYLHVYTWPLYENRGAKKEVLSEADKAYLYGEIDKLEQYINEKNLKIIADLDTSIRISACMADDDNSLVILPDGRIGKCDHSLENKLIGSIYSENRDTEILAEWKQYRNTEEHCRDCPMLPRCLINKNCPEKTRGCDEFAKNFRISQLKLRLLRTYKNIDKI